ncbi:substrate-binding periplasmic protein [Pseudomonas sp. TUM22785]|uniref:substrate-binding periplasmic protein n=1 Tax=Pseudomonas sp. TUM22785 TaxID=3019098 RepID=UPI00230564F9|nr:ABC transporter substrate-binding protein [Pseudomonas sp. TUM22785]WCD78405.1 ABC transporter substrate-binding protein [Pseudomonas sp. TUM22785]
MLQQARHKNANMPRCAFLLLCFVALASTAGERLVYPLHSKGEDPEAYVVELLQLALAHSGSDYQLEPTLEPMPQSRAQLSLERNDGRVQLMWSMTTRERESALLPVRIPIYKGLISWRVFLVRADQRDLLAGVTRREQLQALRMGQRHDWPDTAILRANGLNVVTTPGYESLFRMLDAGRFELFPREVVVAWDEQRRAEADGLHLAVDEHLVLHYPTAFYFFTSRQRPELAAAIQRGLEAAIADGSFERLFQRYHGKTLRRARMDKRQVIELDNPDLPEKTPIDREALWYRPLAPK